MCQLEVAADGEFTLCSQTHRLAISTRSPVCSVKTCHNPQAIVKVTVRSRVVFGVTASGISILQVSQLVTFACGLGYSPAVLPLPLRIVDFWSRELGFAGSQLVVAFEADLEVVPDRFEVQTEIAG